MVGLAVLAAVNINVILSYVENQNEILVFAYGDLPDSDNNRITAELQGSRYVSPGGVVFKSKERAWEEYREQYPNAGSLYERMEHMDYNPMPNTFIVTINDLSGIKNAERTFREIDGVREVAAPHDFAEFLVKIRNTLTIIGGAVILALVIVCLVIIYNSSRASVFARRQEINIMKYVGATNAFVKFPFLIEGLFIGILAGVASWGLTTVAYNSIISMFGNDYMLWQVLGLGELIAFSDISWYVLAANCAAGSLLSATGTIMNMGKHLKV